MSEPFRGFKVVYAKLQEANRLRTNKNVYKSFFYPDSGSFDITVQPFSGEYIESVKFYNFFETHSFR